MKIASLSLALAMAVPVLAQPPKLPANIEKLARTAKETTEVTLDGPLLKLTALFLSGKNPDEVQTRKVLEGLEGIYVRNFQFDQDAAYSESDLSDLRAQYRAPEWSRIVGVRVTGSGDNADIFFKVSASGQLGGIAVVAAGPRELTIVSIVGNIDPSQLIDLGGRFHIPALDLSPKQIRRMVP